MKGGGREEAGEGEGEAEEERKGANEENCIEGEAEEKVNHSAGVP